MTDEGRRRGEGLADAALELFVAGVAHDMNNLLFVLTNNLAQLESGAAAGREDALASMRAATDSAIRLTERLANTVRTRGGNPREVDANAVVHELLPLLTALVGPDISVELELTPLLSPVQIDRTSFERVLLNLVANAGDAIAARGRLVISTGAAEDTADSGPRYVTISVADDGRGIGAHALERVTEPFFSTKEGDRSGSGLGLAIVKRVLQAVGGKLTIESEPGRGTTVTIYVPIANNVPA